MPDRSTPSVPLWCTNICRSITTASGDFQPDIPVSRGDLLSRTGKGHQGYWKHTSQRKVIHISELRYCYCHLP